MWVFPTNVSSVTCFTCLSNKFKGKYSSSQGFLKIDWHVLNASQSGGGYWSTNSSIFCFLVAILVSKTP
jgi:hypothetical protein